MNFKKGIILILFAFIIFSNSVLASKLPDDVWSFVKSSLPGAKQRFDSVVVVSDNIMYIPLYPPANKTVEKISIEYTYPSAKSLKQLPEVVLLNNGFSLLKVFKDDKGNYSLTKKDDLPIKVRLGLMPQDMLTPVGLKMPESLKLTLGDLLIPSKDESSLALKEDEKNKSTDPYAPTVKRNEFIQSAEFRNKKTFINPNNSKFISVYDNSSKSPLYELKLTSMPLKIVTSETSKAALVLYWSARELEIISLVDETTLARIPIDANASDVALNKKENLAYVTSANANKIYVVDLNSMQLSKVIKVDQKPSRIAYCQTDDSLAFFDEFSSKIYNVTKNQDDYIVQPLGEVKNISKVLADVANVYALSRTQSELYIFDKNQSKLINTISIDKKPTDAILFGTKLFILCSKEGYMDIYDTTEAKLISREQIAKDGFYSKITLMPGNNNIIITGINSKNYLIFSLDTMKLVRKQDSYVDVASIVILDKVEKL